MALSDAAGWAAMRPHLDELLDLPEPARATRLVAIEAEQPALAGALRAFLARHHALAGNPFLESGPPPEGPTMSLAGQQVGAYTVTAPIGHGGMGSVWLAERTDGRFERRAAVKFLNRALAGQGEARFRQEGQILARLAHPRIAQLLDAGVADTGQPYLVLEHVDGQPIDRHCETHALDLEARLRLFLDVLDAVAHAHAHLVVHRDLKPSNVLVTGSGEVKLLDFGIAKLVDDDVGADGRGGLTQDAGRVLTPGYAAPEQITGTAVATTTDVYALGVLLFVLLTGRHPAGGNVRSPVELMKAVIEDEPPRPSEVVTERRLGRQLRGDLDTIVLRALKKRPADRYLSVAALADDLRRHLRHEPIAARPDSLAYRGSRFVRRHRWPVAAALLLIGALATALVVVNGERELAEHRFTQVRQLANRLFDIDVQIRQLPGSAQTRQMIVDIALAYLQGVIADAESDPELALELGNAYMRVARVQGVPISANLGRPDDAEANLQIAERLVSSVAARDRADPMALLRMGQIAHDRMILAGLRRPDDDALPLARRSADWLVRAVAALPDPDMYTADQLLLALNNVSNRFRIERDFDQALVLIERALPLASKVPTQGPALLVGKTRILRDRGALDEAIATIREAQRQAGEPPAVDGGFMGRMLSFTLMLSTEGQLLYQRSGYSLDRREDAVVPLRRGFDLLDPLVHRDAADAELRNRLGSMGVLLGDALTAGDPAGALEVYDHVLRHLAEIPDNPRVRRDHVRVLAASTGALRRLQRLDETERRLAVVFERLQAQKSYPQDRLELGSEVDVALSALADDHQARGRHRQAIAVYEELLSKGQAGGAAIDQDLADASEADRILTALAGLYDQAGPAARAQELHQERAALWAGWANRSPDNPFVHRQLARTTPPGTATR